MTMIWLPASPIKAADSPFATREDHVTVSNRMAFHLRGTGGNLVGSEWIAAEGEIVDETADDLEAFMKRFGNRRIPVAGACGSTPPEEV